MKSQIKSLVWMSVVAASFIFLGAANVQAQGPFRNNFAKPAPKISNVRGPSAGAAAAANANSAATTNNYVDPSYYQYGTYPYSTYPNQYGSYPNQYSNGYPGVYNGYNSGFNPYNMNPYGAIPYGYYRGY